MTKETSTTKAKPGTADSNKPATGGDHSKKSGNSNGRDMQANGGVANSALVKPQRGDRNALKKQMEQVLNRQRKAFEIESEVKLATRIDRLNRCISLLVDHSEGIAAALNKDFNGRSRHFSLMGEVLTSLGSLKFVRSNLKKWMKPERRKVPVPMNILGARAHVHYQPKGVVGIMTPWNFPVNMIFSPLADVLGAGNRAMIKPSEHAPLVAALMADLFPKYFDDTEIAVFPGDVDVASTFSDLQFDHLIFTGGTETGRLVLQTTARNMVPATLELGGKSPVIISESADFVKAAENIVIGKSMNSGQACVSPDYVLLPEGRVEEFVRNCRKIYQSMFPTVHGNQDVTAIINKNHYQRIQDWLDEARQQGSRIELIANKEQQQGETDSENRRLPLSIVIEPDDNSKIMQNELFGPVIALKTYRDLDEALRFINSRPRPLALYYFGKNRSEEQAIIEKTCSGGMTINDVMMQVGCDDLPFGGIGASGIGNYRGIDGFRTFSHSKAVFRQGPFNLSKLFGMLPPYGDKVDKMITSQLKK